MTDFSKMTEGEFRNILEDIVEEEGANILSVPGVYSELAEHFNNEILERWEQEQEEECDEEDDTLTEDNIEIGLKIRCQDHPEWGEWIVKQKYAGGVWVIDSKTGNKILVEDELKFWELVKLGCPYCGCTDSFIEGDDVHQGYDGYPCCPECKGV